VFFRTALWRQASLHRPAWRQALALAWMGEAKEAYKDGGPQTLVDGPEDVRVSTGCL